MYFAAVTLRFDTSTGAFDEAPFRSFADGKVLLSVREHFFTHGGLPHLLLCVSWRMAAAGSARPPKPAEDWRGLLSSAEANDRFDRIRKWRNETAKREGKPAYAILTNRQAAEAAVLPEPSLGALRKIDGLGPSRVEQYGAAILAAVGAAAEEPARG